MISSMRLPMLYAVIHAFRSNLNKMLDFQLGVFILS